ncbi:MAG: GntP family permease [Oceanospirillales bacterium]|nr:GntP family permease [Oceanospirillales bacterium]MBR9886074.1 GntP family permease [Oceanospirillales bacterium]
MMEYAGLLGSVVLLIVLALRGVNIILSTLICSLFVILTNDLPLAPSLSEYYVFGPLGAFTFAGKFFLLFAAGSIFGRVMGESHAAAGIAMALIRRLGAHRALWITTLACALLTYGGVVVFVVIFAIYPLGLKLLQQANIPKRLFCGALALGAATFTLTTLPGTPSIHNVIASVALGTDLFAGLWIGIAGGLAMFLLGMWYLERERKLALINAEGFVPGPADHISDLDESEYPHWLLAALPLIIVIGIILLPRLVGLSLEITTLQEGSLVRTLLEFANSQPIIWPSLALFTGSILAALLFPGLRRQTLAVMGQGTQDSVMPLINTAAVIGFGGIVTHTAGFLEFTSAMVNADLPPLISAFFSVSLVSAITGSASGGLQIFMQTMAPAYVAMGLDLQELHRITTMASGGLDSLPHSGAVVATLTITGLTHKQAYKDIGVITVVIPVLVTVAIIAFLSV